MREAVAERPLGDGGHHAAAQGEVDGAQQRGFVASGAPREHRQVEVGPDHGGELEHVRRDRVEAGQALAHDLAHSIGAAELGRRPRQPGLAVDDDERACLDERPPQLDHEEGVALGEVVDRLGERRQLGAEVAVGRPLDELADLDRRQPLQPQRHDALGAAQVDQRRRELGRHVGLEVAERGHEQHAGVGRRAGQVAQQEQRRRVRPVRVLEHDQERPPA